ncbi:MAG TPA: aromatic ring-hydroxylating dioxygenase subunit alpha [Acidimicrobiales bacterium]|nr:aromatic ring-hydroxylating dioxygenase subunit alpha [Acidimicrobiales bacterium]
MARDELARVLLPFGRSRMLPRAAYVDPAVFAWERSHFLAGGWACLGRTQDVANPGDQVAQSVGDAGVLLARGEDGVLRAFANACRHRGHELLPCGRPSHHVRIICPYHAWSYALDGELRAAAGFKGRDGFDAAAHGLVELPLEEWHGLVFVDSSGTAGPLYPRLAALEAVVAPYEPERLLVAGRHEYEVAANWKILTENYHECYHCPMIHAQLCAVSPPRSGKNFAPEGEPWVGGTMELREGMSTMSFDGHSDGVALRGIDGRRLREVVYLNVFPNVLLSLHPDYVMTHRLTPLAADRTRIECTWAFAPEAVAAPGFDPSYAVGFWDVTNEQDWSACESVQRGLSSAHAVPGPLSEEEDAVYQYVTMVARGYLGEPVRNLAIEHASRPS